MFSMRDKISWKSSSYLHQIDAEVLIFIFYLESLDGQAAVKPKQVQQCHSTRRLRELVEMQHTCRQANQCQSDEIFLSVQCSLLGISVNSIGLQMHIGVSM